MTQYHCNKLCSGPCCAPLRLAQSAITDLGADNVFKFCGREYLQDWDTPTQLAIASLIDPAKQP